MTMTTLSSIITRSSASPSKNSAFRIKRNRMKVSTINLYNKSFHTQQALNRRRYTTSLSFLMQATSPRKDNAFLRQSKRMIISTSNLNNKRNLTWQFGKFANLRDLDIRNSEFSMETRPTDKDFSRLGNQRTMMPRRWDRQRRMKLLILQNNGLNISLDFWLCPYAELPVFILSTAEDEPTRLQNFHRQFSAFVLVLIYFKVWGCGYL